MKEALWSYTEKAMSSVEGIAFFSIEMRREG
jgi:hypothetical protein